VGRKAHSRVPSRVPKDPSNLGGRSMDARRSTAFALILTPLAERTVNLTSAICLKPKLIFENKLPVVAIVAWQLL
jgi:hypothetical protein